MLEEMKPNTPRKSRKRVGRGIGSGTGKTAGRGHKGQKARAGGGTRPVFEGGQTPLFQTLPKRGFQNVNKKEFAIVNLSALNVFEDDTVVDLALLQEKGLVKNPKDGLKILANGSLDKKLTVKANHFSQKAKEAIEKNGGTAEVI